MKISPSDSNLDAPTKHSLLQILGDAISDISREYWYAGWLGTTEQYVPELCRRAVVTGVPQKWGQGIITPERACGLRYLAETIGSWVDPSPAYDGYVPYQPFPIPAAVLSAIDLEQTKA